MLAYNYLILEQRISTLMPSLVSDMWFDDKFRCRICTIEPSIKFDGGVYKTEYLTLDEIGAHESRVLEIPESGRGTSLFCFVQSLQAPGLSFHYNVDQADAE